ncbi:MAG: oligosaccharide flippase family protein [Burkholderiaceae bacterium]
MDTRRLLSTTLLYGIADVVVLAVGGFALLPLYTRTLSQAGFGTYVIVRTNIEILTYLLYLGLPSAVARLYFDHRKTGLHIEYMSSVLTFFGLVLVVWCVLLYGWGESLWALLSPSTPAAPYLGYALAITATGFFSAIGTLWLRLEGRVAIFSALQVGTSFVLAAAAIVNLAFLHRGLPGLLSALLVSSAFSALILPWLIGRRFRLAIHWPHIAQSLRYALPIMLGYIAYFVLNRISTLILQRHVEVEQMAIFGLAQQLAMMLTIAAAAFGKATQPAVFAAEAHYADELLVRSGRILMRIMFTLTAALLLFASELFSLVAPASYSSGHGVLLILLVASFAYSFNLISDTALLFHRRPKTSVAISTAGALLSVGLGMWLIPRYQLYGAALAIGAAFFVMALLGQSLARRLTGISYLRPMLSALGAACALAGFAAWLGALGLDLPVAIGVKLGVAALFLGALHRHDIRRLVVRFSEKHSKPCLP